MNSTGNMAPNRPTIRDVAALSRSSLKTVSRVINGESGVSSELEQRVKSAIADLGYRHNLSASNLRRTDRKTATIGVLLENVANPFFAAVLGSIENIARAHGSVVFAGSLNEDSQREHELFEAFSTRRVDGLIIAPTGGDQSYLARELAAGTAVVFIDRPPNMLDADSVVTNNFEGARAGVQHLIDVGHRRIAVLGDRTEIATAQLRQAGAIQALADAGLDPLPDLIRFDLSNSEQAEEATCRLFDGEPPTAIFAAQNLVTIGAIRALRRLDLQRTVALVGFDDFLLADLLDPPITVIAQSPATIGRIAAETLFARLNGDQSPSRHHVVTTQLITRGSGEIPPSRSR